MIGCDGRKTTVFIAFSCLFFLGISGHCGVSESEMAVVREAEECFIDLFCVTSSQGKGEQLQKTKAFLLGLKKKLKIRRIQVEKAFFEALATLEFFEHVLRAVPPTGRPSRDGFSKRISEEVTQRYKRVIALFRAIAPNPDFPTPEKMALNAIRGIDSWDNSFWSGIFVGEIKGRSIAEFPSGFSLKPELADFKQGFYRLRTSPDALAAWASVLTNRPAFIDFTLLESRPEGKMLLLDITSMVHGLRH